MYGLRQLPLIDVQDKTELVVLMPWSEMISNNY